MRHEGRQRERRLKSQERMIITGDDSDYNNNNSYRLLIYFTWMAGKGHK